MSQLLIRTTFGGQFYVNVTRFSSPVFGTMISAQTKTMMVHFPIKAQQPELQFDVIFASVADYQAFQGFVRSSHLNALYNDVEPGVILWWPQRGILNWTGTIRQFAGGGQRFVYAPKARFTVDLVDSFVSRRTVVNSQPPKFATVYGAGSPDGIFKPPSQSATGPSFPAMTSRAQ